MVSKKTKKLITFQETIFNLQNYWSNHGCLILQPYDVEVGAGTFHPATTLRSLGPEKWKAAYVQPSSCLLYTSPSPRDMPRSRMPSSA